MIGSVAHAVTLPETADGSAVPARWRILGWLVFTTALALGGVLVVVINALSAGVARDANADVSQDLVEFTHFAAEATDPETGKTFTSMARLSEVFLRRQSPRLGQVIIAQNASGGVLQQRSGPGVDASFASADAPALLDAVASSRRGVLETSHGELRWAKAEVELANQERGQLVIGVFTEPRHAKSREVQATIINVSLVALIGVAIVGWLVAGQILRPIRVMREVTASVSHSDLQRRIPVHGRDDVAQLAATINEMLDRLDGAFIAEQRFVNDASRELEIPIERLVSAVDALAGGRADTVTAVAVIRDEVTALRRVLADLRALVEAEHPGFVVPKRFELQTFMQRLSERAARIADRTWTVRSVRGTVDADPERLSSAMLQLADNAVGHTSEGDKVNLVAEFVSEQDRPFVRLSVVDEGPGITAEEAERVFDPFVSGPDATGVGLGLTIVRAIAEAHGGCAFVESGPGQGATFGILIPRYRDDSDESEESDS